MRFISLTFVALILLVCRPCTAQSPISNFTDNHLPSDCLSKCNWLTGKGKLSLNQERQLVIYTDTPTQQADNRVGITVDLGQPECDSFLIDLSIDPASNIQDKGVNSFDCGLTIGMPNLETNPNRFQKQQPGFSLNIRDLYDVADYGLFWRGKDLTLPVPVTRGSGNPRALNRNDGFYQFRIFVTPTEAGSRVRIYHTQFVTPSWDHHIPLRIRAGQVGFYTRLASTTEQPIETTIRSISLKPIDSDTYNLKLSDAESVLYSLNLDYPGLENVKSAMQKGDIAAATKLFARYLRHRTNVKGPAVSSDPLTTNELNFADLMTRNKILLYTGGPLFEHDFGKQYDWAVDPYKTGGQFAIYNSRMFPWIQMDRAYQATQDSKYPKTFVKQLNSWLDQIPLRIIAKQGEPPFFIDGHTLEPPLMFTGSIGRRIELTWWQAYELFKHAPEFDDASLMRMMKYFQENARLVTNPSVFFAWDDSGLHMATGLLQCATMMPEWKEAQNWKNIAFDRLEQTFRAQVHLDGTHASLSTGYGWATIDSYRNVFEIMKRNNQEIPPKFRQAIRGMVMGYMGILRPDFGNISLNDGGWGLVDDKVLEISTLFPNDEEIRFFATRGMKGTAPSWKSRYFSNAGWFVMRTDFGPNEKYLFMDGGPFGASHGKQDALHLVVACGNSLLLRDGGRGDYTQKPTSIWSSKTLAFNTLTPNWALQDRTYRYEHEKQVGLTPPNRPWVSNKQFDYGQSVYDAGWFSSKNRVQSQHTRHVIFLKGNTPPQTGYWVVVDQVNPNDEKVYTWRHPWHLSTENIMIDKTTQAFTTQGAGANLQILSIDPESSVSLSLVKGQTEPVLQGWKVHGSEARPATVPMHSWKTSGRSTKAWVLLPRLPNQKSYEISRIADMNSEKNLFSFILERNDDGKDHFTVSLNQENANLGLHSGKEITGVISVIRKNENNEVESFFNYKN